MELFNSFTALGAAGSCFASHTFFLGSYFFGESGFKIVLLSEIFESYSV